MGGRKRGRRDGGGGSESKRRRKLDSSDYTGKPSAPSPSSERKSEKKSKSKAKAKASSFLEKVWFLLVFFVLNVQLLLCCRLIDSFGEFRRWGLGYAGAILGWLMKSSILAGVCLFLLLELFVRWCCPILCCWEFDVLGGCCLRMYFVKLEKWSVWICLFLVFLCSNIILYADQTFFSGHFRMIN